MRRWSKWIVVPGRHPYLRVLVHDVAQSSYVRRVSRRFDTEPVRDDSVHPRVDEGVHAGDMAERVYIGHRFRVADACSQEGSAVDRPRQIGPLERCTIAVANVVEVISRGEE